MKASAVANANVALVKYWGKRDPKLMLPQNSSISVTLDGLYSHTTVEFGEFESDQLIINGKEFGPGQEEYDDYVGKFLAVVRELAGTQLKAKIVSQNNFPTGAGLASSAAGFAALALACSKALGLPTDPKSLSILARRGSGSATRSVLGGFVEWKKGEKADGSDSYAEQIADENHWPEFRILAVITSRKEKKVKSRAGMAQTVKTCPFYPKWLETVEEDLRLVRDGILEKNFTLVGSTAEYNCLKMHATMITTKPPIIYWNPATLEVIHAVQGWREEGLESYFTIDAGPQVKVLCLEKDVRELEKRLKELKGVDDVIISKPGGPAKIVEDHLF